ncbi:MAG: hypothetical protein KGL95_14430 [Patescibacteria group bacterium]|nr:hypothetical protein [Patescibacteria group bacterium]
MPSSDFLSVVIWWGLFFLIGISCLPMTFRLFPKFFDRGYIFAKVIGLMLLSYLLFVLGELHVVAFTRLNSIVLLILIAVYNGLLFVKPKEILMIMKKHWRFFLFEEGLFFFGLFLWSFVRATQPDIHGLEKYMDFGFINSILRTVYFPPKDMWYTPFYINYYYFGHLATAVLTRLSNIPSYISFNLMLATIFAFTLTVSFVLGIQLLKVFFGEKRTYVQKIIIFFGGILSSFLLTFCGNLQTIYTFFKPYSGENVTPFWQLPFLPLSFPNSYWYPNATRFIYHTIHEFPIYSFVVSDLHGHVLDIPFVLLTLALFFSLILSSMSKRKLSVFHLIGIGFILAILYMTNAWDGLIYFLLSLCILIVFELKRVHHKEVHPLSFLLPRLTIVSKYLHNRKKTDFVTGVIWQTAVIFAAYFVFSLPFSLFFQAGEIVHGIGVLCMPTFLTNLGHLGPFLFEADHCQKSPIWQLGILYGFFAFWCAGLGILLYKQREKLTDSDLYVFLLVIVSMLLIIIPEFFYLKDIYPAHYRANTMFKLVYQAFIMLSLSSGYAMVRIAFFRPLSKKWLWGIYKLIGIVLFGFVAIYPYFAISSYYNDLKVYSGLNGIAYLQKVYPTDSTAISWLNATIVGQPVILEAQGDSYTDYARVSSNTGLPTVLGWTVHEWLWRGSYDPLPERISDVQRMYESTDPTETKQLLDKYHVSLVFVGTLERQKYTNLNEAKFITLGKIIFQDGTTRIYQIYQ